LDEEKKAAFIERMRIAREKRAAGELPPKKTVKGRPSNPLKPKKKAKRKAVKAPKKSPIAKPVQKVDKKPTIPVEQNLIKIDKEPKQGDPIIRQQPLSLAEKKKLLERARFLEREKDRLIAMRDFEYFLDTFVYIENKEKKCAEKLVLWPGQREVIPDFLDSPLLVNIKTRQVGITWIFGAAYVLWLALKYDLHLSVIISASEDHAKEFLDRVYFILDRLPDWFVTKKISTRTVLTLEFIREAIDPVTKKKTTLASTIKSMPTIEMGAESKTPNVLILDEAHVVRAIQTIFNSSYPGIEAAKGRVIIIANSVKNQSSPGWPWVRDFYMKSKRGETKAKRLFLPWTVNPDRPPDFRERMVQEGMDFDDVIMHFPATEDEALASASGSFFGKALERHSDFVKGECGYLIRSDDDSLSWSEDRHGMTEIWDFPETNWKGRYAIGSDVAEGLGSEFSVAYVLDRSNDSMVAKMRSNRIDADAWGIHLKDLSDYYGGATVCCERNGAGITTIKCLERLYVPQYVRIMAGKTGGVIQKTYGWSESTASRYEACGDLKTWLSNTQSHVKCGELLYECTTFIKADNGKPEHEPGKFDDCVFAAAMAIQCDKFQGSVVEIPQPDKPPPTDTLEYVAHMDRLECLREVMQDNEDTEW
jgi:hypothetical protein